jgi:SAM-dependent methyltransferase
MIDAWRALSAQYETYLRAEIPAAISPHDNMYDRKRADPMDHYLGVGRSAIDILVRALALTGKTRVNTILDLPCGGGRVTRHLMTFFPESEIFVGELDRRLEDFVLESFGVERFRAPADFSGEPEGQFDLIFVGSLLTHFDEDKFKRALAWFIGALAPGGLLAVTTHGRQHDLRQRNIRQFVPASDWEPAFARYNETGFGYVTYPGQDYGLSICKPSWLLGLVESDPSVSIVSFQEAAWNDHQDVLVLQRRTLAGGPPIVSA